MEVSMIEKRTSIGAITVKPSGHLEIRIDTQIYEDGQPLGMSMYHRYVLAPGDDLANQPEQIISVANAVWTPEVISAYQAMLAEQQAAVK